MSLAKDRRFAVKKPAGGFDRRDVRQWNQAAQIGKRRECLRQFS
jgi:hypothetical protein